MMFRSLRYITSLIRENYICRKRISNLEEENQDLKNKLDLLHHDIDAICKQCNHEASNVKSSNPQIEYISKHINKAHDYLTLLINQ